MKIFFMVVGAVYVLYLLFLIVRACSELRHMPYVGKCVDGGGGWGPCKWLGSVKNPGDQTHVDTQL